MAAVQAARARDRQRGRERSIVGKSRGRLWSALLAAVASLGALPATAAECPTSASDIATDRPDITNSSIVVPVGSLQSENGVNLTSAQGAKVIDGANSRLRLGIAPLPRDPGRPTQLLRGLTRAGKLRIFQRGTGGEMADQPIA
jgi:hypothetical protein